MLEIGKVSEYIKSKNYAFDFDLRLRQSDDTVMLYIPSAKVANHVEHGFTSVAQLKNLQKKLKKEFSINSEIILIQSKAQQDLESGFFQILNRKFNNRIVSLYTSFHSESIVDAYIEVTELTEATQHEITEYFASLLNKSELQLGVLQWLDSPSELPTLVFLLRKLKTLQPVNLAEFTENLQKDYSSTNTKWASHKLDQLRKKGYLLRQKSTGTYVLTDLALQIIPAGTRRTSSDIDRALALGNRKWWNC